MTHFVIINSDTDEQIDDNNYDNVDDANNALMDHFTAVFEQTDQQLSLSVRQVD